MNTIDDIEREIEFQSEAQRITRIESPWLDRYINR